VGACEAVQFAGVTRPRFACLQSSASQQLNLTLNGDSGSATDASGKNTVTWDFDESTSVLTLEVTSTPYPCFLVKSHLNTFVASCP
jgi:hypothetical protein